MLAVALIEPLWAQDYSIRPGHAGQRGFQHRQAAIRGDKDIVLADSQASLAPARVQAVCGQLPEKARLGLVEGTPIRLKQIRIFCEEPPSRVHHGLPHVRVHSEAHFPVIDVDDGFFPLCLQLPQPGASRSSRRAGRGQFRAGHRRLAIDAARRAMIARGPLQTITARSSTARTGRCRYLSLTPCTQVTRLSTLHSYPSHARHLSGLIPNATNVKLPVELHSSTYILLAGFIRSEPGIERLGLKDTG